MALLGARCARRDGARRDALARPLAVQRSGLAQAALAWLAARKPEVWGTRAASTSVAVNVNAGPGGGGAVPFDVTVLDGLSVEERAALRVVLLGVDRVTALLEEAQVLKIEGAADLLRAGRLPAAIADRRVAAARVLPAGATAQEGDE